MKFYLTVILISAITILHGQAYDFSPFTQNNTLFNIEKTELFVSDELNKTLLLEEDAVSENGSFRAGIVDEVDLSLSNSGTWFDLPNGDKVWRIKLKVPNALAVNLYFKAFYLPKGACIHAFSPNYNEVLGAFTQKDNPKSGYYATEYVHGEIIILEYYEPKEVLNKGRITIEGINGFYKMIEPLRSDISDDRSEPCEVDVICTEGNGWEEQRDGVVKIIVKNNGVTGFCSGSLVNNTAEDCTPYILSAHHCATDDNNNGASTSDFNQWIFIFKYHKYACGSGFSINSYSVIGASKKANSHTNGGITGSDFLLLELNDTLDETKAPYFNGWNATGSGGSQGVSIHHPTGDFKKISTYNSALSTSNWFSSPSGTHWRVYWVATANGHGVSEGGSSGSPIFNENGLIVGQLSGGLSYCNNIQPNGQNQPDLYGKMSYNWNGNGNIQSLKTYLDPVGNGTTKTMVGNYYLCSQDTVDVNGIIDVKEKGMVEVFPNPTKQNFKINGKANYLTVLVFNQLGQPILKLNNYIPNTPIDVSFLNNGLYIVKIEKDGIWKTEKIIKY